MKTVKELFSLAGKTALVTGGSRGLGLQIAQALGEQGAAVVLASRKQEDLEGAVGRLQSRDILASATAVNLATDEGADWLVAQVMKRHGPIDILVNNAGASWGAPAEDYPVEAWDKVMNLNLRGAFLLSQAVGRRSMIPQRHGRIINVASICGLRGNAPTAMQTLAYNTSKGGLVNFTRTLAGEWGRYGITVNALAPGFFPSKMSNDLLEKGADYSLVNRAPLGRLGDDEDLKGAAVLFASEAGKHITGQILAVDGGVSAVL